MDFVRCQDKDDLGLQAAAAGAESLRQALAEKGSATILVATGASQFATLKALVEAPGIDWSKVTAFHLDEYLGLDDDHPASFRRYLQERFVSQVPLKEFHAVNGTAEDPQAECDRLEKLISSQTIDVAFIGIGENAHLAFNDPPADFTTDRSFLVVTLDQACRQQQFGEGWFPSFEAVPEQAISMSVSQIMKAKRIICSVPDERKAAAVQQCIEGPVTPDAPASILQKHANCTIFIDPPAASRLQKA